MKLLHILKNINKLPNYGKDFAGLLVGYRL